MPGSRLPESGIHSAFVFAGKEHFGCKIKVVIGKHLVVDPKACHGKLTFNGTRVPVSTALTFLSMGDSIGDILRN